MGIEVWFSQQVTVKRFAGQTVTGPSFAAPAASAAFVDAGNKLVSTPSGETVLSIARVFLPAGTADIPVDSLVTLPVSLGGHEATVVQAANHVSALGTPDHVELVLA